MKAMVNGTKSNGESFTYIVEDIENVFYTNENITLVTSEGSCISYANAIEKGYKYKISIV